MTMNLVIQPHNQQIDALEGVENGLRRRSCRGSFRVPRIQTRQPFFLFGQLPPPLWGEQASRRCKACSLQERCQPQATHAALAVARKTLFDPDA